jgi:hypothetical protein
MMARAFMVAALLALASAPGVRADEGDLLIPMNAKGKYAEVVRSSLASSFFFDARRRFCVLKRRQHRGRISCPKPSPEPRARAPELAGR